ncbi:small multidrug efflux protein [Brachybacterium hainanense]|uniref:Small multidrug efflux protein n=1 Tax=Brachybacterium hainanense TaxID=1541174 RepID=A0ABV6R5R7_9MICO
MDLIDHLQNLLGHLPGPLQPLVSALAGMIPFVEGEGGAAIGILGGVPPIVAALAAIAGNFLVVAVLVLASSGARRAVVARSRRTVRTEVPAAVGADGAAAVDAEGADALPESSDVSPRAAARREKFQRAYERFGVPGVSLLGPLLLPTHFTATMLAATGVRKGWILLWQGIAIVGWTTLTALIITGVITVVR